MLTNYHTHTTRCGHAEGTEEEYILTALRCGYKVLGFSDHTPWAYATPGFVSHIRMLPAQLDEEGARALADELAASLTHNVVVTGLQLDKYIACAGAGRDRFVVKKLHIARSFPGTGDLYGAVLIGSLIQGNALSAAADNAAEFVALAIQKTPCDQDTRFGVWFEPLLPRLCPMREE